MLFQTDIHVLCWSNELPVRWNKHNIEKPPSPSEVVNFVMNIDICYDSIDDGDDCIYIQTIHVYLYCIERGGTSM